MNNDIYKKKYLDAVEYVFFIGLLLASSCVGIYFAYRDRKNISMKNYYFGGKNMSPLAVGLSMAVTFQSAVVLLAVPAETYTTGSLMLWEPICRICGVPIVLFYLIPKYHKLQLATVFEFLEMRYNAIVRRFASVMNCIGTILYAGGVMYMPAAALNAVTPLTMASSILLTGVICTFYTALGGMKAVIWTDVLQSSVMIIGLLAIFIQGLYFVGGFGPLIEAVKRGGRDTALRFDYGIISRLSPISIISISLLLGVESIGIEQAFVQRFQSCKTVKQAQWSLLLYVLPTVIITFTSVGNGLLMYAYFEGCDPVLSGELENIDQGLPYMALKLFNTIPGMTGLFAAAIFSGSFSTISSVVNSLSVVILEDFVAAKWPMMSERIKVIVGKSTVICLGALLIGMTFGISYSKTKVFELIYGFSGLIYGPLLGLYIVGFFMPWVTSVGAMTGLIFTCLVMAFHYIGKKVLDLPPYIDNIPPVSNAMCKINESVNDKPLLSYTTSILSTMNTTTKYIENEYSFLQDISNINFNFLMFISFSLTVVVGLAASFATGHTPASKADPKLFIPLVDNKCFSPKVRKFFRFGVPELKDSEVCGMSRQPMISNGDHLNSTEF